MPISSLIVNKADIAQGPHPLRTTIERPKGSGDYVFIHFHTPVKIHTRAGTIDGEPGDCILYTPGFRQWYCGRGVGFCDDWIHMQGRALPRLIARYTLPTNTLFRPRDTRFVGALIQEIKREVLHRTQFWEEAAAAKVEELLRQLARNLMPSPRLSLTAAEMSHLPQLRDVRMRVLDGFAQRWTVPKMARLAHLSTSRFACLYQKSFGVSPVEDLIRARLERAQWHLSGSNLPIGEVARNCGFTNVYYFSRLFRRRMGCAPSRYAVQMRNGAPPG